MPFGKGKIDMLQAVQEKRTPAWRAFSIGGISAEAIRQWAEGRRWSYGDNMMAMLRHPAFTAQSETETVDTIILTLADFGFDRVPATTEYLESEWLLKWSIANAVRLDGSIVDVLPAEAGPRIRQQYPDQPKREILGIAMKPIPISVDDDDHHRGKFAIWLRKTFRLNPVPRIFCVAGHRGGEGGSSQKLVAVSTPIRLNNMLVYRLRPSA